MKNIINSVKRFVTDEDGATAVEYAVMLALIIAVCIVAIQTIGTRANNAFTTVGNALPAA